MNWEALWLDASEDSFYAYDGGRSANDAVTTQPPYNALWQFLPSGNVGSWKQVPVLQTSNFSTKLDRVTRASYAYGNGLGFALGGMRSSYTEVSWFSDDGLAQATPGLVVYNTTTQEWYNVTSTGRHGYSVSGHVMDGVAHFVPSFGPAGILFVFGGIPSAEQMFNTGNLDDESFVTFAGAYMYEPTTQQWQTQLVTGENYPPGLANPCVVGIQGESSYEVRQFTSRLEMS